ncbi:hypothetical protein FNAPI_4093 [Fusarium napiforme]|uniref:LysM domain-containing protein n=1 Tax=Fusarium napiforme TaxID=42672 RepID=A0A8H5JTU7_9HYPO|nr:hypothetical protein FNAPI_4093 [Fusarium napiforme]
MHLSTVFVHGLVAVGVTASRGQRLRRQDGQVDPGQPSDCTWWETKEEDYQDCTYLEEGWNLKHSQFVEYNPSVKDDCSGMQFGHSYCVEVNNGIPRKGETTTSQAAEPEPTKDSKPSPTQAGLIDTCTSFYQAKKGDTCAKIISDYKTFDFDTFFKWNPAVGKDCSGIWANYYYCVGIPGTATVKPSATSPKPTATGGVETPSPIQEGIAKNCNKFHQVAKSTTCSLIESYYNLPFAQFLAWNPAVGKDCSGLWANYWVCISVEGYKPATTTTAKPTTTKPANGIETPSPIQNGMVKNCEKFHQIKSTTTCTSIENYYNLPFSTFLSWNPAVGKDCTSLLTNYWVCVATVGWKPPTKTTAKPAATTTKSPNGISTPPPIQNGMVSNCNKFHMVTKTTTCDSIQNYYKISMEDFAKWNPAVGSKCTGLWANYNVCVGVIGGTPTKPSTGVKTPSPIQSGMVSNCKKFHPVASTTTCDSIQKYYKITMAQLVKWNPAVGAKCTGLWAKYYVCVGV